MNELYKVFGLKGFVISNLKESSFTNSASLQIYFFY